MPGHMAYGQRRSMQTPFISILVRGTYALAMPYATHWSALLYQRQISLALEER